MFLLSLGLFVDVGNNYSVLDHYNVSFIYEDVDDKTTSGGTAPELVCQKVSFLWCCSLKQEIGHFLGAQAAFPNGPNLAQPGPNWGP